MHELAVASQKFTWPTVTGVDPARTVAVSVTTLPDATVVTERPPAAIASAVTVEDAVPLLDAEIVRLKEFDVPPPGVGLSTLSST